jgi:Family of unknown function (DUF6069)
MNGEKARFQTRRVAFAALAGGTVAAVANTALFLVLHVLGVDFVIQPDPTAPPASIAAASVPGASFILGLLAGGLLVLLGRFTTKARGAFIVIASVFTLLSLAGPATIGGASAGTRVALMVMHLLAAAVISGALVHRPRTRDDTTPASVRS